MDWLEIHQSFRNRSVYAIREDEEGKFANRFLWHLLVETAISPEFATAQQDRLIKEADSPQRDQHA